MRIKFLYIYILGVKNMCKFVDPKVKNRFQKSYYIYIRNKEMKYAT